MQTDRDPNGMSTHELVLEMRGDVKSNMRRLAALNGKVDTLVGQDLDHRLDDVESWTDKVDGRMSVLTIAVASVGGVLALVNFVL